VELISDRHETLSVELAVRYGQVQPEADQYHLVIGPLSDPGGRLEIQLRGPSAAAVPGSVLPARYAAQCESLSVLAIKAAIHGLFGQDRPAPRIVGVPEWTWAALQITRVRPHLTQVLRRYELSVESSVTACLMRYQGAMLAAMETFELCREDADPLYALTRLTLRSETAHAVAARSDGPFGGESLSDPALRRPAGSSRAALVR
jgi:hypothetical protein